jgi:HAE1 family hydrophobic/amphiphilic exporter-1
MADAMPMTINLVYVSLVILVRLLLAPLVIYFALRVPVVILFVLPLVIIGGFVSLSATGRERKLSAIIGLLMLIDIVVTNAIVLLDLTQHRIEASADVRTVLTQGGRTHVRLMLMTAAATIPALIPPALSSDDGLITTSLATVMIGGLLSSTLLTLVVIPVIYLWLRRRLRHDAEHRSRATDWRRSRYRRAIVRWL